MTDEICRPNGARPLVIYHGNCTDGFTAAWCFWRKFGDKADYHPGSYGAMPPDCSGRTVYMVDFSYPREIMLMLLDESNLVYLLDHHKTAIEDLAPIGGHPKMRWNCDLNRSGAGLAWDFLFPDEARPALLNAVEDRDLWRFKLPMTREANAALTSHKYDFKTWDRLMAGGVVEFTQLGAAGAAIMRKQDRDMAELLAMSTRMLPIAGHLVPVANVPFTMASEAGSKMSKDAPFAATYIDTPEYRLFSLRSSADNPDHLDVGEIAKQYGGGGHKHASGFRAPRDSYLARA